ncbi:unnamed protein product [Adineta steineri]|uniref:Uncharacterized protein n=2 Tax=Adineta steineri TaxID=433720 RepID=A0A819LLH9_9BILA|nr:unnamed protein product [Adineta steineri]CAF1078414.1 unnamed protein product [Adineta steineri]CAF3965867.1 unnamed protein product [Adineta steineri]
MMTTHGKMLIITSDEDLIRQAFQKKNTNTQVIQLDNNKPITSINNNDNNYMNNIDFLKELAELNSKNDQIYKRALDSPHHDQSKVKLSKKSLNLNCAICGDHAIGFNYDVLSCASCKAFFLRNANLNSRRLRCITGEGNCSVAHEMQRKCPGCRLDRCLNAGMRKDYLLTEEEKQRRKKPMKDKRTISSTRSSTAEFINSASTQYLSVSEDVPEILNDNDRLLVDIDQVDKNIFDNRNFDLNQVKDVSLETLSVEDWISIENVRTAFLSIFENAHADCACNNVSDRTNALISWSQFVSKISLNLIKYFRQIDEFENLHNDDRFLLIKYNLHSILPIFKCFIYKPNNDCCSFDNNAAAKKQRQFFMLFGDSYGIRDGFINLVHSLVKLTGQDPTLLSLLMLVVLFTPGISMNIEEPLLKDPLAVHRAQNHYTQLLWNYLISKQGEIQACKHFTQLLSAMFQIRSVSKNSQEFIRYQMISSDVVNQIAPVMQSVLHIS